MLSLKRLFKFLTLKAQPYNVLADDYQKETKIPLDNICVLGKYIKTHPTNC